MTRRHEGATTHGHDSTEPVADNLVETMTEARANQQGSLLFLGTGTSHGVPMIGCDVRGVPVRRPARQAHAAVGLRDAARRHGGADRHGARLPHAGAAPSAAACRRRALHARPRRSRPWARRPAALQPPAARAHPVLRRRRRRWASCGGRSATSSTARRRPAGDCRRSISSSSRRRSAWAARKSIPVPLWHGRRLVQGYRIGSLAYLTDCSAIPDSSWALLDGVDLVVIDALRHRPHPTHFTVAQALAAVERLRPVARVVHPHLPRPAARRHQCQPARGRRPGI